MADLHYITTGLFTHFMPNTAAGESVWRTMAEQQGDAVVLTIHLKNVLMQIRKAGYSVCKAPKPNMTLDQIYSELETW